jgi:IS30 family transposase
MGGAMQHEIAGVLGRASSSIGREVKRNRTGDVDCAARA